MRATEEPTLPMQRNSKPEKSPSIPANGEVLLSSFSCSFLITFPTPSSIGIPICLCRCPSHLNLTGKEMGTSGMGDMNHREGKKTKRIRVESGVGGEWPSWNTGSDIKQVGEHKRNKAHHSQGHCFLFAF